jgi:hypothetical protein
MEKTLIEKKAIPGSAEFLPVRTTLIKPRVILRYLAGCIVFLIAAHLVGLAVINKFPDRQFSNTINRLFNLDLEANIPTFFSALLMIVAASLLFFISTHAARHKIKWKSLGCIFIFLCLDEAAQIHEETIYFIKKYLLFGVNGSHDFNGFLTYSWVVLYGFLFIGIAFYFFKFVFALPPRTRNLFIVSAVIYVSGAIGCEMIGGHVEKLYSRNALWWFCTTLEETLEMAGMSLFIYALLDYLSKMNIAINFTYENRFLK